MVLLIVLRSNGQGERQIFDQFTGDNGLSDNTVNDIVQDEKGFIWIATSNGLNRFDGSQFKKFFRGNKPTDLPGNVITKLVKMPGNYIVIGTERGMTVLNTRTNECRKILMPSPRGMERYANDIQWISTDSYNELIVSSQTGIFVFDDQWQLIARMEAGLTVEDIKMKGTGFATRSFLLNKDTTLVLTNKGVVFYDKKNKRLDYLKHSQDLFYQKTASSLDRVKQHSIGCTGNNILFFIPTYSPANTVFTVDFNKRTIDSAVSTINLNDELGWKCIFSFIDDTTFLFNSAKNGYFIFHYFPAARKVFAENKKLLPKYIFNTFYFDKEKRLWFGTENYGLLKQSFLRQSFKNMSIEQYLNLDGTFAYVRAFYSDKNRQYIGLQHKETGLLILDKGNRLMKKINLNSYTKEGNDVWSITKWNDDTIAIATQSGLLFYSESNHKISKPGNNFPPVVNAVPITTNFRDEEDNIWLGLGFGNGVLLYSTTTNRVKHFVPGTADTSFRLRYPNCIAKDTTGNLWFIHKWQGITRWSIHTHSFDTLITAFDKEGIPHDDFVCLDADREGNLWVGFSNYGLMKLNIANGETTMYTTKNGLVNNSIINVFAKVTDQVWFLYRNGMGVIDTKTGTIKNFNTTNGLPDYTVSSLNFYYEPRQRQLTAGFVNTFTVFDPFLVGREKSQQEVYITEIKELNDSETLDPDKEISLKYFQNNISFSFSTIDYDNSLDINYEYRLYKNENTQWINISHQQTVNFVDMHPGNYVFQVRVVGDINSVAIKKLSIGFPFFQTWWFYTLLTIITAAVLYGLYRYRIHQLLQVQKVRNRISADLHDDIGARLTNINLLSALSEQKLAEPQEALDYLKRIEEEVQTSGEALDDIVWSINTKNDSVEEITARMRRYAADVFDDSSTRYTIRDDENILLAKLSMEKRRDLFLIYKEMINNIHKHATATEVDISIEAKKGSLLMKISDNGKGFDPKMPTHRNGLKNIHYRIEKYKGNVTIRSVIGKGTTFIIQLPCSDASLKRSILKWFTEK